MPELIVSKISRAPFLAHSQELLAHLMSFAPESCRRVLEIGCGPQSPLVPMLERYWPEAELHQIDARPDVIKQAAAHNPRGIVEPMLANDMYRIPNESKDAVIAMAVFDQNPESAIGDIAKEVHRVLVDGGVVIYIHNEELNLPATAASMLYSSLHPLQLRSEPRYLLPSDRWQPTNDLEYCSGHKDDIDEALGQLGEDGALLSAYIHGVHPGLTGTVQPQTSTGKVETHFIQKCTVETMRRIRQLVSTLQTECGVQLRHHATADLLADKTERQLCSPANGFEVLYGGMFELRRSGPWTHYFESRPEHAFLVRGVARFGYATSRNPAPVATFEQVLNTNPSRTDDYVVLTAYQYGMIAKKI